MSEAEAGWIDGPFYDESEVSEWVKTTSWICTRRFPLQQPTKIRLIDDGLESGLNSAYSCYNKLTLMDMDAVVALANTVLQAFASNGVFRISSSTGEVLTAKIHAGWNSDSTRLGRTLDLTAACKQLAVNPSQGFVRVMVAYDPVKSRPAFFIFNALRFGATGSVYSFNRVAKSLWHIMVSLGGVWATQYYDDYPSVELRNLADNSRLFMESILDALGWRFASEGKKAKPPLPSFKVLGVVMDMSHSSVGKLVVSNKPERIDDLVRTMGEILDKGYLSGSAAASLHGQLNFAQGQYYGCTLKPGIVFLQKVLRNGWHSEYRQELATVVCYITLLVPSWRRILYGKIQHFALRLSIKISPSAAPATKSNTPTSPNTAPASVVLAFTDGAYEPNSEGAQCSSGLVVVDSACEFKLVQEVSVSSLLIQHWARGGAKQLIVFLELWPILVFLARYGKRFHNRRAIIFIDNNAVRDALIKGSSPLCDLFCMLALCSYYISSKSICSWFTRVASDSNPGDDPSRGRAKEMAELIGAELATSLEAPEALVKSITSVDSFIDFMKESVHSGVGLQPIENGGGGGASLQ